MNERERKNALEFSASINLHANCEGECCTIVRLDSTSSSLEFIWRKRLSSMNNLKIWDVFNDSLFWPPVLEFSFFFYSCHIRRYFRSVSFYCDLKNELKSLAFTDIYSFCYWRVSECLTTFFLPLHLIFRKHLYSEDKRRKSQKDFSSLFAYFLLLRCWVQWDFSLKFALFVSCTNQNKNNKFVDILNWINFSWFKIHPLKISSTDPNLEFHLLSFFSSFWLIIFLRSSKFLLRAILERISQFNSNNFSSCFITITTI